MGPETGSASPKEPGEIDPEESQKGSSRDEEILRERPPHH